MSIKGLVSIFVMPQEIDDLHLTLYNLKRNVAMLPRDIEMDIDLTFCMSRELTDWENTKLPQEYFLEKFYALTPLWDWSKSPRIHIEFDKDILGCVSQRRWSLERAGQYDFTVWLDTDVFFKDTTLLYTASSVIALKDNNIKNFIITPELVRQWDPSWDVLVNQQYTQNPLMYHESADIISDSLIELGDVSLRPASDFKFGGGWFTVLSNELLQLVGIPESFGHYGLEDTFIVEASKIMRTYSQPDMPQQYIMANHIVGETYVHRCNSHMKKFVASRNRKEEFREIATKAFGSELLKFRDRIVK
jgi:hypothetical protein